MANERETENIVRDELRRLDYYNEDNDISVEEQKSNIEAVKRLLKSASKSVWYPPMSRHKMPVNKRELNYS